MADKIYSLPIPKHIGVLFPLVLNSATKRIAEDLAISDLFAGLSCGLRRIIEAQYFASGIKKILTRSEIVVS